MRTVFAYDKLLNVASRAFDLGGAMRSLSTMEVDLSGSCERPVFRTLTARPSEGRPIYQDRGTVATARRDIDLWTRCRKCGPCLRMRSARWRYRAKAEIAASARSWFVTLTLSPQEHFKMLLRASDRLAGRGVKWDTLSSEEQFAARHAEVSVELTKWLKRVRKQSGSPLRYCLVAEAHKSGLPHYHALIHEVDVNRPVRARHLRGQWRLGFSQASLVAEGDEAKSASYVAKYLSKSAISRVRASLGYGHAIAESDPRRVSITPLGHSFPVKRETPSDPPKDCEKLSAARHRAFNRFLNEVECSEPADFVPRDVLVGRAVLPHRRRGSRGYGGLSCRKP